MDLAGAMQPVDIVDLMELDGIEEKPWHITWVHHALVSPAPTRRGCSCLALAPTAAAALLACPPAARQADAPSLHAPDCTPLDRRSNALTGAGVDEGISWLAEHSDSTGRKARK